MTDCPKCNGAGTIRAETTDRGEDDHDAECPACCGTGSADLADAINALPYSLHRVKPGVEVVSKAAVLAIIKARAAIAAPAVPPGWPKERLALNTMHHDCHKAADAFWRYWGENGETHKRGYYESTWGAINQALRTVGVVEYEYPAAAPTAQPTRAEGDH